jgi:hypothetical protein
MSTSTMKPTSTHSQKTTRMYSGSVRRFRPGCSSGIDCERGRVSVGYAVPRTEALGRATSGRWGPCRGDGHRRADGPAATTAAEVHRAAVDWQEEERERRERELAANPPDPVVEHGTRPTYPASKRKADSWR